jgi:hypothetical protein
MQDINEVILEDLRWHADQLVMSPTYGELWWLKQMPGYITDCCPEEFPCEKHAEGDYYSDENKEYRDSLNEKMK